MANVLNISSSSEPVVNTSPADIGGKPYSGTAVDKNTGASGGLYKSLEYDADKARKYVGVPAGSLGAINVDGTWKAAPTKTGAGDATTVKMMSVSFDSIAVGSASKIRVVLGSQPLARLSVGEAVVIPVSGDDDSGEAIAEFKVYDEGYSADTHEANVTAILIGA